MEYKKFLMQHQSFNGISYTNVGSVVDTYVSFGVVCQEFPFKHLSEVKEAARRDWSDSNGEDVFIPSDGLKIKAYDVEAKFLYSGDKKQMHGKIVSFLNFLYGRDSGGSSLLSVYDEYTHTGRRGVYVQSVSSELYDYSDVSIGGLAVLKVKFRITDPVTNVILFKLNFY